MDQYTRLTDKQQEVASRQFYARLGISPRSCRKLYFTSMDLFNLHRGLHYFMRHDHGANAVLNLSKISSELANTTLSNHFHEIFGGMNNHPDHAKKQVKRKYSDEDICARLGFEIMKYRLHQFEFALDTTPMTPPVPAVNEPTVRSEDGDEGDEGDEDDQNSEKELDTDAELMSLQAVKSDPAAYLTNLASRLDKHVNFIKSFNVEAIAHAVELLEIYRSSALETARLLKTQGTRRVVLLGETGIGKSFLINLLLMLSEVAATEYNANPLAQSVAHAADSNGDDNNIKRGPDDGNDGNTSKDQITEIESPVEKLLTELLKEEGSVRSENEPRPKIEMRPEHLPTTKQIEEDTKELQAIFEKAYPSKDKNAARSGKVKYAFLLPVATDLARACTSHEVRIHYGPRYQLLIRFFTQQEVLESLNVTRSELHSHPSGSTEASAIETRLSAGLLKSDGVNQVLMNADDVMDALRDRNRKTALVMADLTFAKGALNIFNSNVRMFSGKGTHIQHDRIFIREKLTEVTHSPIERLLVRDVHLFAPSTLLDGDKELIDCPGLGDGDEFKLANTIACVRSSELILVVLDKNLQVKGPTLKFITEYLAADLVKPHLPHQAPTAIQTTDDDIDPPRGRRIVHFLGIVDRTDEIPIYNVDLFESDNQIDDSLDKAISLSETWKNQSCTDLKSALKSYVISVYNEKSADAARIADAAVRGIQFLAVRPLLFASIVCSPKKFQNRSRPSLRALEFSGGLQLFALLESMLSKNVSELRNFLNELENFVSGGSTPRESAGQAVRKSITDISEILKQVGILIGKIVAAGDIRGLLMEKVSKLIARKLDVLERDPLGTEFLNPLSIMTLPNDLVDVLKALPKLSNSLNERNAGMLITGGPGTRSPNVILSEWLLQAIQKSLRLGYNIMAERTGVRSQTHLGSSHIQGVHSDPPDTTILGIALTAFDYLSTDAFLGIVNADTAIDKAALSKGLARLRISKIHLFHHTLRQSKAGMALTVVPSTQDLDSLASKILNQEIRKSCRENGGPVKGEHVFQFCNRLKTRVFEAVREHVENYWTAYLQMANRSLMPASSRRLVTDCYDMRPIEIWKSTQRYLENNVASPSWVNACNAVDRAVDLLDSVTSTIGVLLYPEKSTANTGATVVRQALCKCILARSVASLLAFAGDAQWYDEVREFERRTTPVIAPANNEPVRTLGSTLAEAKRNVAYDQQTVSVASSWHVDDADVIANAPPHSDSKRPRWSLESLVAALAKKLYKLSRSPFEAERQLSYCKKYIEWVVCQRIQVELLCAESTEEAKNSLHELLAIANDANVAVRSIPDLCELFLRRAAIQFQVVVKVRCSVIGSAPDPSIPGHVQPFVTGPTIDGDEAYAIASKGVLRLDIACKMHQDAPYFFPIVRRTVKFQDPVTPASGTTSAQKRPPPDDRTEDAVPVKVRKQLGF